MSTRPLTNTFRSVKPRNPKPSKLPSSTTSTTPPSAQTISSEAKPSSKSRSSSWCVYLIASTNPPIKTYVGVTTNFPRRLKQHNGELKGGAKASRSGRPWVCACLINGFCDRSEACKFETKWKGFSRKLSRKRASNEVVMNEKTLELLQHRELALDRVKDSLDCSALDIAWHLL